MRKFNFLFRLLGVFACLLGALSGSVASALAPDHSFDQTVDQTVDPTFDPRLVLDHQVASALELASSHVQSLLRNGDHWNLPLYMGANYVSQYYLMRFWLSQGRQVPATAFGGFDEPRFKRLLLSTQLSDGSWMPTPEANLQHGNLDATIMNYWALKVMGLRSDSVRLSLARTFILEHGGLEKASAFSRIVFALFGQISWSEVPWSPLFITNPHNPSLINISQFPQWVRPHILPIAYLRSMHVQRDLGPRFSITDLHASGLRATQFDSARTRPSRLRKVIVQMLSSQASLGSWGGYTSATLFTIAALDDYLSSSAPGRAPTPSLGRASIVTAEVRGLGFINALYLSPKNPQAYLGTVCDGRYWDSILLLQGMASVNPQASQLENVARYLKSAQVRNGGIPFGRDFEASPDLDDTSELITTFNLLHGNAEAVQLALAWLITMQNSDGGWGAFDRNNTGNFLLRTFASGLRDSATLFDPSTPDVTGHALEALGSAGYTFENSSTVRKAVEYLRKSSQTSSGIWPGRWGVNYLYGTSAAVSGLLRVGVRVDNPFVTNPLRWITAHQNPDGGFGESTQSDLEVSRAGVGASTASQTAWALMALVRFEKAARTSHSQYSARAAKYLVAHIDPLGSWTDSSVVGTGHSGVVYLAYPSYPLAFPMIALSEYLQTSETSHITDRKRLSANR